MTWSAILDSLAQTPAEDIEPFSRVIVNGVDPIVGRTVDEHAAVIGDLRILQHVWVPVPEPVEINPVGGLVVFLRQ